MRGIDLAHRWRPVPTQFALRSRWDARNWLHRWASGGTRPRVRLESCISCGLVRVRVSQPGVFERTDEHYITGLGPPDWRGQTLDRCDADIR